MSQDTKRRGGWHGWRCASCRCAIENCRCATTLHWHEYPRTDKDEEQR